MKLKQLFLRHLPGYPYGGFEFTTFSDGLNVILGPNGSGKTSICRAIRKLLWPNLDKQFTSSFLQSEWAHEDKLFTITFENDQPQYSSEAQAILTDLPDPALAACFNITIDELFDSEDLQFAQKIAQAIAGGYDLKSALNKLAFIGGAKGGIQDWKRAKSNLDHHCRLQEELSQEVLLLPELEKSIQLAEEARIRITGLEKILKAKMIQQKKISLQEKIVAQELLYQTNTESDQMTQIEPLISKIALLENAKFTWSILTGSSLLLGGVTHFLFHQLIGTLAFILLFAISLIKSYQTRHQLGQVRVIYTDLNEKLILRQQQEKLVVRQQMEQQLAELQESFVEIWNACSQEEKELIESDTTANDLLQLKNPESEKVESLNHLYEKRGNLKARIEKASLNLNDDRFIAQEREAFGQVQMLAREFVSRELLENLIQETEKEYQKNTRPMLLEQASRLFQKFTKNQYLLEAPVTDTGVVIYEAVETATTLRKKLNQLSRGTRMQLLLAVRLAIALSGETLRKNLKLPLFLDEVLATTDAERFEEIADGLIELAQEGRQIFYSTSNPVDVWRLQKKYPDLKVIDLSAKKGFEIAFEAPLIGNLVLPPEGADFHQYVCQLKCPSLQFDQPIEMSSVHYLLEDPQDLYRMLTSGIARYGNLKAMRAGLLEQSFSASYPLINRRSRLLEQFFTLKKQGLGKPLSRDALVQGGVSKVFIDRLWSLAQGLNLNAQLFIEALEKKTDERTKRFSLDMVLRLKEYFLQQGYLDEKLPLSDDQIRQEFLPLIEIDTERRWLEQLLGC